MVVALLVVMERLFLPLLKNAPNVLRSEKWLTEGVYSNGDTKNLIISMILVLIYGIYKTPNILLEKESD